MITQIFTEKERELALQSEDSLIKQLLRSEKKLERWAKKITAIEESIDGEDYNPSALLDQIDVLRKSIEFSRHDDPFYMRNPLGWMIYLDLEALTTRIQMWEFLKGGQDGNV
jgi:hypothetical protein